MKPEAAAAVAAPGVKLRSWRDQLLRPAARVLGSGRSFFFSFTYKQPCVPYKHATAWAEVIH